MAMTQQQYIARKGVRCPFCGNEDIAGDGVEIDAGYATQEVTCHACGGAWEDQYQLTGYRVLEVPTTQQNGVEEIAATTASTYFAVSGRIPGDYEDTTLTFSLPEKATREDAVQAFEAMVYKSRGRSREDVIEQYGEPLYIGEVLQSATPINKV